MIDLGKSEFEKQLEKFAEEGLEIKKIQVELEAKNKLFGERLSGFLKENGLPENFAMTDLMLLVARKVKKVSV